MRPPLPVWASLSALAEKFHYADASWELPPAEPENLRKIAELINETQTSISQTQKDAMPLRDSVLMALTRDGYLKRLLELFARCEAARNLEALHLLWNIFKGLVLMSHPAMLEVLFSEENALAVMGALEYDPAFPVKHREYLTTKVMFKEVVPFGDPSIVRRIHQTFRFQYLKDVVLPRQLDDGTFATINSLIYFNNMEIVQHISNNDRFLTDLFRKLKASEPSSEDRLSVVLFLQELCSLTKMMQAQGKIHFYRSLVEHGLCDIFRLTLPDTNVTVRSCSTEILGHLLATDPSILRSYILSQPPDYRLLHAILRQMIEDPELGIKIQLVEIVRMLIDTSPPAPTAGGPPPPLEADSRSADKEDFLNVFYSQCMNELVSPFAVNEDAAKLSVHEREVLGATKNHVCELLSFCLQHHGYRIKSFVLGNNIAAKVLRLLREKEAYLLLAGVRFFRAFVGQKDEFYQRHIMKLHLFDPIVEAFRANGDRYNLLQSAIVELFEFITRENLYTLMAYLVERFEPQLREITYVDTFRKLLLRHYQHREFLEHQRRTTLVAVDSAPTKRRAADDDDEAYFNASDEEPAPSRAHTLPDLSASLPSAQAAAAAAASLPSSLVRAPSRVASWDAPPRPAAASPSLSPSSVPSSSSTGVEPLIKRRRSAEGLLSVPTEAQQPQQHNHSVLPIE